MDLSSLHGPLRPPRRPNNSTPQTGNVATEETDFSRPVETTEAEEVRADDGTATATGPGSGSGTAATAAAVTTTAPTTAEEEIQILDLHGENPLVAYGNQIFSCSWADQLGTELLLTAPDEIPDGVALTRGKDFDLVAANRVKILGHKAHLISGSEGVSSSGTANTAASAGTGTGTGSNQARFLERLAAIKQSQGETDAVRTVFSTRRTQQGLVEERLRGWTDWQRLQDELQSTTES